MKLNLNLTKQGFILIGVPLFFELVFISILLLLLHQVELQAEREARAKDVTTTASYMGSDMFNASAALLVAVNTHSEDDMKRFQDLRASAREKWKRLEKLVQGDLRQEQALQAALPTFEKLDKLLGDMGENNSSNSLVQLMNIQFVYPELEFQTKKFQFQMSKLVMEIDKVADPESVIKSRNNNIKYALLAGVGMNVLLAVLLAIFFNAGTRSRIAVLVDNIGRLARAEPLKGSLKGEDEIAQIDKAFHDMAGDLAEATRKERAIVDNAVDVICSLDVDRKFVRVNPASAGAWGYESKDLIGRELFDLVPEESRPRLSRMFDKLKTGQAEESFDGQLIRKDGSQIDILWSAHWSSVDNSYFCVAHDVTRQKELERLKKEFVAMITHDLRSPLTGVMFSTGLLNEGAYGDLTSQAKEELTSVEDAVNQMLKLINDLLFVEKLEAGKMQLFLDNVQLSRVLERSVKPLRSIADHEKVSLVVPATDAVVHADEDKLARVMINLVSNALKFTPAGGEVRLDVESKDGYVEVRVCDSGPGIPEDKRESIFERFKQVDQKGRKEQLGTGLGLAICKEIVELHGGEIGVESEEGSGSTFWFRVPSANHIASDQNIG